MVQNTTHTYFFESLDLQSGGPAPPCVKGLYSPPDYISTQSYALEISIIIIVFDDTLVDHVSTDVSSIQYLL